MFRLLLVVTLLCMTDVFASFDLACLQKQVDRARSRGFSVLALNFQKEDTFLITDLKGISKDIKFVAQWLNDGDKLKCTVIPDRENRVKCVELQFEVFGKKYMVFAGVYKENGVYPRLSNDFQKARCLDGWIFDENKGKLCDRREFQFAPQPRSCSGGEETFLIQAEIELEQCANKIFQSIHSKGLVGRVFFSDKSSYNNYDDLKSPHNDPNIKLVGWEEWIKKEGHDIAKSKCQHLEHQRQNKKPEFVECHLQKVQIFGKAYLVLYGVYHYDYQRAVNHDSTMMQCQAGLAFDPKKFFPCHGDPANGFFIEATPEDHE